MRWDAQTWGCSGVPRSPPPLLSPPTQDPAAISGRTPDPPTLGLGHPGGIGGYREGTARGPPAPRPAPAAPHPPPVPPGWRCAPRAERGRSFGPRRGGRRRRALPGPWPLSTGGDRRPPPRGPAPRAVRPALPRAVRSCAERGRWSGAARPPPAPALRRGSIPSHPLPRAAPPRGGRSSGGRERQRETEARGGGVGGSRGTNRRKETRGRGGARVRRRGGEKRDGHGERGGDRMGAGWAQGQGKG